MDGVILLAFILGFPANETVIPIAMMIYMAEGALNRTLSAAAMSGILLATAGQERQQRASLCLH